MGRFGRTFVWRGLSPMLDPGVRPRVHQGLVPVVVPNQVRRSAVLAAGLDNDRRVLMHADHFAFEVDPVTYRCSHPSSHP
jgi:hypothetical protein